DPTVPPVFTQAVGDNQFHADTDVVHHLHLTAVTFNVLSLGRDTFETPALVVVHQDPRRLLIRFSGKSMLDLLPQKMKPDFVAVPIDWTAGDVRATFRAPSARTRLSRRTFPIEALTHPSNRDAVAQPHHPYLSEATWELQGFYAWSQRLPLSSIFAQDCYISELAHTIATAPAKEAFAAYHRILAHRRKKAFRLEPLPGILKADGDPCADAIEVQQRWRQHFAGLEAGMDTTFTELAQRTQATGPSAGFEHPLDVSEVPSLPLLRRILASTKSGKASGMDSIPPELNRYFADESADLLYPLLLKFLWRGEEALGHKGGQAVVLYKGRGPTDQCQSYRSILLMNTWAKAFHQSIRPAIKTVFEASAPALQLGGRAGCSVALGSHVLRSLARYAHQHSLSGYVLYADISAAFYSALVQLVAHSEAQAELTCALQDPSVLSQVGVSPWLEKLAAHLGDGNWFMVAGDATPVATARGTRPGSSWADILFAFLMPRILRVRDQILAESHHEPQPPTLPWDGCKVLEPCDSDQRVVISDIIWADDIATPRLVAEAGLVEANLRADVTAITEAFFSFGFRLSFGDHKTAAVVTLCGHRSRQVKRRLFGPEGLQGKLPVLLEHLPVMQLPLTAKYKHLGVMQAPHGSILEEIRYRAAQARRSTVNIPRSADQHVTAATCFSLLRAPDPEILLRTARLSYLGQALRSGPDALWASIRADQPYAELLRADLRWLHAWCWATTSLPHPDTAWRAWADFILSSPGRFKGMCKRAKALSIHQHTVVAALDGLHRLLTELAGFPVPSAAPEEVTHQEMCLPCKRSFPSRVSWAGHAARCHGYRSRAFLLPDDRICRSCGKVYATIGRLRRHLVAAPVCSVNWGSFIPAEGSDKVQLHPLALPVSVSGVHDTLPDPDRLPNNTVSLSLLNVLMQLDDCTESEVWEVIEGHIEPLATLRSTVSEWQASLPPSSTKAEIAENMLLLLDPTISADTRQPSTSKAALPEDYVPAWKPLSPLPVAASGTVVSWSLEPPPPVVLSPHCPTSMSVRAADAYAFLQAQALPPLGFPNVAFG
ncbi:unnamed protein product, partial [Symbiodinium necroappetens]